MQFDLLPPREQIVMLMRRLYVNRMTTTSGGNLSILDDDNNLWISPAGIDKGTLTPEDIICVKPDGTWEGRHRPSSEYPFHRRIYEKRPDVKAIMHAHPSALVAFSIVRKLPDTYVNPQSRQICGSVGYAPYAMTGSSELGEVIADTFEDGYNVIMLENHGAVTVGDTLLEAYHRLETLEYCARLQILASNFKEYQVLTDAQIERFQRSDHQLPEFTPEARSVKELEVRQSICKLVQRAVDQQLMISTTGTISARTGDDAFLITPYGMDRKYIENEHLVLIKGGMREQGKIPSRAVNLHRAIYQAHPDVNSIMTAQPPHACTYSITSQHFDTRTIPESYVMLRSVPVIPYGIQLDEPEKLAEMVTFENPVLLLQNDSVLTIGKSLIEAFDRLEVAEFSAQSLLDSQRIGPLQPIGAEELEALERKFFGKS